MATIEQAMVDTIIILVVTGILGSLILNKLDKIIRLLEAEKEGGK